MRAIRPIVTDLFNFDEQVDHYFNAYSGFSSAVHDYVDLGLFEDFRTPSGQALIQIVDPFSYWDRLDMPKYSINSTGDEFFVLDSSQFYFDDLPGTKYLRYVPNTSHRISDALTSGAAITSLDVVERGLAFILAVLEGNDLPQFSWPFEDGGRTIHVVTDPDAGSDQILLWVANNPDARDFRLETIGAVWESFPLTDPEGDGVFLAQPDMSGQEGFTAFVVEMRFPGTSGDPANPNFWFWTEVKVFEIPEPASLMILGVGTLVTTGRRRGSESRKLFFDR